MMMQGIRMNIITCVIPIIIFHCPCHGTFYINTHSHTYKHTQNRIFTAHDTNISYEYIQTLTMAIVNCIKHIQIECHVY